MCSTSIDRVAEVRDQAQDAPINQAKGISALVLAAATAVVIVVAINAAHAAEGLFQTTEDRSSKRDSFYKWNEVLRRYYRERQQTWNTASIRRWHAFIEKTRAVPQAAQIHAVNRFVNQFAYRTDSSNYGRPDYWATPREFFAKGGDAEDYAIVKYLTFKALGWKQPRLRLAVVIDQRKQLAHAVLAVYHDGQRYILDNQFRRVMLDTQIGHYRPVYSINERHWWFHTGFPKKTR